MVDALVHLSVAVFPPGTGPAKSIGSYPGLLMLGEVEVERGMGALAERVGGAKARHPEP